MSKINSLTSEQEAFLPIYREEWVRNGENTARVDADVMHNAVTDLYISHNMAAPVVIVMDSPFGCLAARTVIGANLGANLRDNLWANLGDNLRDNLRDNLWSNLRDNLWANLGANLGDNLRDNLWANLGANLWDNLGANLWDNLKTKNIYDNASLWGGYDVGWLAFYDFVRQIGHKYPNHSDEQLTATITYSKSCGWLYAYKGIAFVSQKPTVLQRMDDGRLHCPNGPAMGFADGYGVYAWRGIRVPPEWIINKKSLTAKVALTHSNMEQRRAAIEILGWNTILKELEAKSIDKDGDPQIGELLEVALPDLPRPSRFLRVLCGTGREFAIGVPNTVETALDAQAWVQNVPRKDFTRPEIRT